MTERRGDSSHDNGERRRKSDVYERQEEFRLLRDKILLTIGAVGVMGIAVASISVGVKDSALALAALTVFAGLLGMPTALRLDEKRKSNGSG